MNRNDKIRCLKTIKREKGEKRIGHRCPIKSDLCGYLVEFVAVEILVMFAHTLTGPIIRPAHSQKKLSDA